MKKIILLMLLAFTSTTYANEYDDKANEYINLIDQICDNIYSKMPNEDLHLLLKERSDVLLREILDAQKAAHEITKTALGTTQNEMLVDQYKKNSNLYIQNLHNSKYSTPPVTPQLIDPFANKKFININKSFNNIHKNFEKMRIYKSKKSDERMSIIMQKTKAAMKSETFHDEDFMIKYASYFWIF
ncbi:MAG: hypothetical protein Q8L85_06885 [Alphaproteobacteria bacterium]|nr:hypothetical protein [Alphaproteobacteria bacterium]